MHQPRFLLATVLLLAVAPLALVHCGTDGAADGGEVDDDGDGDGDGELEGDVPGRSVAALCKRYFEAECDYAADCYGNDEEECLEHAAQTCEDATDASTTDVDRCVSDLDETECGDRIPRACKEAITYAEEDEDDGGICDPRDCGPSCDIQVQGERTKVCTSSCESTDECAPGMTCADLDGDSYCFYECSDDACPEGYFCQEDGICSPN